MSKEILAKPDKAHQKMVGLLSEVLIFSLSPPPLNNYFNIR